MDAIPPIYSYSFLNFKLRYYAFRFASSGRLGGGNKASSMLHLENSCTEHDLYGKTTASRNIPSTPRSLMENGMYYYSARYYAPPTFISRPMFEKYPSISPYTYCSNNPVNVIDPTGKDVEVSY